MQLRTLVTTLTWTLLLLPASLRAATHEVHDSAQDCANALEKTSTHTTRLPEKTLRILSWNTMKFERSGSLEYLQKIAHDADFLFLQESLEALENPSPTASRERFFSPGYRRGTLQTGVEIRSAFHPDVVCQLTFMEPWLNTEKAVTVVRIPFEGNPLLLANLHAINFTLGSSAYSGQLKTLGSLVAAHRGPTVIGGDFNHWNPWREWVLDSFVERSRLTQTTFVPDWRSRHLGTNLDTFLYRDVDVISTAAMPTGLSDHHPIQMSLELLPADL